MTATDRQRAWNGDGARGLYPRTRTSNEKIKKIKELHAEGLSLRQVAAAVGVSYATARKYVDEV